MSALPGAVLLAALAAAPVRAQTASQTPGEPVTTRAFPAKTPSMREREAPLALALNLAFGTTVWTQVQVSTAGPVADVTRLVYEGYYKREIIEMIVMSADARRPLKEVLAMRHEGRELSSIAATLGLDADAEEDAAIRVEDVVDRDYLPLFPEHKLVMLPENSYDYWDEEWLPW